MKKLILIIACAMYLNANLNTNIKNIIGPSAYNTHKNLINYVFSNKSAYYNNGQVNYVKLTQKLQSNGLLKLRYPTTRYVDITFNISNTPTKSLKILKDVLKSLGHYYYFTQEAKSYGNGIKWTIKLKTEAAINPLRLSTALAKRNCKVTNIIREGSYKWNYSINSNNSNIYKAKNLVVNNQLALKKSLKPYMVKIDYANAISINSNPGNRWYPNVVFYDNDLNIIDIYKDENLQKSLRLDVPTDTKYIKIDDLYSLANLKRGISITKE